MTWVRVLISLIRSRVSGTWGSAPVVELSTEQIKEPAKVIEMNFRNNITIILSPGHGAIDPKTGKYVAELGYKSAQFKGENLHYKDWFIEGVMNRHYARDIEKKARERGYQVKNIVHEYLDTSLNDRVIAADAIPGESVLIPIHFNAFKTRQARGLECYTTRGHMFADDLSELYMMKMMVLSRIFKELKIRTDPTDGDMDKEANFKEIKEFEKRRTAKGFTGSHLYTEIGFFDNVRDKKLIMDPRFMEAHNDWLLDALDMHYKLKVK